MREPPPNVLATSYRVDELFQEGVQKWSGRPGGRPLVKTADLLEGQPEHRKHDDPVP